MRIGKFLFSALMILAITSLYGMEFNLFVAKRAKLKEGMKAAVLPMRMMSGYDNQPDAKRALEGRHADKLEIALLNAGFVVIERTKVQALLKEQAFDQTGATEADAGKVGKLLSSDIVVYGEIAGQGFFPGNNTGTVGMSIKGISVKTGQVLFKVVMSKTIPTDGPSFSVKIAIAESELYEHLGKELAKAVPQ